MMLMCCCAKARKDEDITIEGPENRIKNINRILLEFVNEESKLGLKEVPIVEMIEKVLVASNKGEIAKKEIIQIYKSLHQINQTSIKNFMIQDFFFVDSSRQKYDFNKIVLFNLLYSGGKEIEKANFLFNVVENSSSMAIHNHSQKLLSTLENLACISSIVVGEIINSTRRFHSHAEDSEFQELLSLYSTNSNMLREFANHAIGVYLFSSSDDKQYLMRDDFIKKMEACAYLFIKPHEIRKKYTEYVWQNKARAMLPSRPIRRTKNDFSEESKNPSDVTDSERQSAAYRNSFRRQRPSNKQKQQAENNLIGQMKQQQQRMEKIEKLKPLATPQTQHSNKDFLNKSGISDVSMAIYRYEDKSNSSPQNRRKQSQTFNKAQLAQNAKNWEQTETAYSPVQSPMTAKLGIDDSRDIEKELSKQIQKMSNSKYNSHRESQDTSASLMSTTNMKKYGNVHNYLREMFGEQFINFVADMHSPFDDRKESQLQKKLQLIKNQQKLEFPDYNSYPAHVREIFEYFKAIVHKEDLLEFAKGKLYRENIVNVYIKILEKINLMLQSQYNYQRATTRNSIDLYSQTQNQVPQKILYFNTNFSRKLNNESYLKDCLTQLKDYFKYDQVVLPFFIDEEDDQRSLMVTIKVENYQVDLYDRERETDNHDISDTVLHLMDLACRIQELEFSEDQIDGGVEGICVGRDEDMIVAMCYIAECVTFGKTCDLETFNVNLERQRVLNVFLNLLHFE